MALRRSLPPMLTCCVPLRPATQGASLLITTCLALAPACGDDGTETTSEGSTTTAIGSSTTAIGSSTTAPGSSSDTGDTTAGSTSSDTTAADTTGTTASGDSSSDSGESTGATIVDVPFTTLDPYPLALSFRAAPGWTVIETAEQWTRLTAAPIPAGVSFPEQWVVYGSHGPQPFPGHRLDVSALSWDGTALTVEGQRIEPAADCSVFEFNWPTDTLLAIDALDASVRQTNDTTTPASLDCAAGVPDFGDCNRTTPCAPGLICAGLIRSTVLANSPGGLCMSDSNRGVFEGGPVPIDADGAVAEGTMEVTGLTTVDMDVVVWLELDHPAPQELIVELRNPDGNQVSVANLQAEPLHPGGIGIVPTGFSGDESVNGEWTLVVQDAVPNGNGGAVASWQLEIMSRFD